MHLKERVNFAVLVAGDVKTFSDYGRDRGWRQLRVVSAADSDLKQQLGFETDDGAQFPGVSVIVRQSDGSLIHFYSQSALMGDDRFRGMDLLTSVWNFFDLTPDGRSEWFPKTEY